MTYPKSIPVILIMISLLMMLTAVLPQAASAQVVIDKITVKDELNDKNEVVGVQISFYTSEPTISRLEYGTTIDYGLFNGTSIYTNYHEVDLVGLQSHTLYHYRITVIPRAGAPTSTLDYTFRTGRITNVTSGKLTVTDVKVTYTGDDFFIVTWKTPIELNGQVLINTVEDFTNPGRVGAYRSGTQYESVVHSLRLGTKYYWQVYVFDNDGNYGTSSVQTFTTAQVYDQGRTLTPLVMDVSPLSQTDPNLTATTVVISWRTNVPARANLHYWSTMPGVAGGVVPGVFFNTSFSVYLKDLKPNTPYLFSIDAGSVYGRGFSSGQFGFITKPTPPSAQVAGVATECYRASWTYQQCRNFNEEKVGAIELRAHLNQAFRNNVPAAALRNWYTLVNAYTYGGYPREAIVAAVKHGGKTVHPTIPFSAWQNSPDYKAYFYK